MPAYVDPRQRYQNRDKWNPLEDFMAQLDEREKLDQEQADQDEAMKAAKAKRDKAATTKSRSTFSKVFDQVNPFDNSRTYKQGESQNGKNLLDQAGDVGQRIFAGSEKVVDSVEALTGISEARRRHWEDQVRKGKISKEEYQRLLEGALKDTEWAGTEDKGTLDRLKTAGGVSLEATSEIAPTFKVGKALEATAKGGALLGGALGAAHGLGETMSNGEEEFNPKDVGLETVLGALGGGAFGGLAQRAAGRTARAASDVMSGAPPDILKRTDGAITEPGRLLGSGVDTLRERLKAVDDELDVMRGSDPNSYATNPEDLRTLAGEPVGNPRITKAGEIDQRNTKTGVFAETHGATLTSSSDTAKRARELMRERTRLETEIDGLDSAIGHPDGPLNKPKLDFNNPRDMHIVDNELQAIDLSDVEHATGKINYLTDYFRTPTTVLKKIGLGKTAKAVENAFEGYRREFAANTAKVAKWRQATQADPSATQRIFAALEGDNVPLTDVEQTIVNEMKTGFKQYADRLGIPEENRISDYVTHIFDGDFKGDTIDPMLARILEDKPTGRVYNPYTQKRLGKQGYKEDAFEAFEVYSKKAARAAHMDKPLKMLAGAATDKNVDAKTADFILNFSDRVALKPAKLDKALNYLMESVMGDKQFDVLGAHIGGNNSGVRAAQAWRNNIYRATLGLNVSSALRNLTQATNTFAELGTRDTLAGYSKMIRAFGQKSKAKGGTPSELWQELEDMGVVDDALHRQDDQMMSLKKGIQKADNVLWFFFDTAERINRGSAYFGAKSRALRKGMDETAAREFASDMVAKTQFKFNDIETPLALRSQVAKTLTQFQSFNLKQGEFLGSMVKQGFRNPKEGLPKLVRWIASNIAIASAVGEALGIKWYSSIPWNPFEFRGVESPTAKVAEKLYGIATAKNDYGQDTDRGTLAKDAAKDVGLPTLVPGGTQIKKTTEGLDAQERGISETDAGRARFLLPKDDFPGQSGIFGQYSNQNARDYFDRGGEPLGKDASEALSSESDPKRREQMYDFYTTMQGQTVRRNEVSRQVTDLVKQGKTNQATRVAREWNAEVDLMVSDNFKKYGYDPDLEDALKAYKLSVESSRIKARAKSE